MRLTKEQWLDRYLYTKFHEIFLCSFLVKLYEWIEKLVNSQGRCRIHGPIVWTLELVHRLEVPRDKITHAIDHWLDHIIGGFVTKFMVDTLVSYNEEKWCFSNVRKAST